MRFVDIKHKVHHVTFIELKHVFTIFVVVYLIESVKYYDTRGVHKVIFKMVE